VFMGQCLDKFLQPAPVGIPTGAFDIQLRKTSKAAAEMHAQHGQRVTLLQRSKHCKAADTCRDSMLARGYILHKVVICKGPGSMNRLLRQ
jgi:hypothetical protein